MLFNILLAIVNAVNGTKKSKTNAIEDELSSIQESKARFFLKTKSGWRYVYDEKLQKSIHTVVYPDDHGDNTMVNALNYSIGWENEENFHAFTITGREFSVIDLENGKRTAGFEAIDDAKKYARALNALKDKNLLEVVSKSFIEVSSRNRFYLKKNEGPPYTIYDKKRNVYVTMIGKIEDLQEAQIIAHLFNLIHDDIIQ